MLSSHALREESTEPHPISNSLHLFQIIPNGEDKDGISMAPTPNPNAQKKRLRVLQDKWVSDLGLRWSHVTFSYSREPLKSEAA